MVWNVWTFNIQWYCWWFRNPAPSNIYAGFLNIQQYYTPPSFKWPKPERKGSFWKPFFFRDDLAVNLQGSRSQILKENLIFQPTPVFQVLCYSFCSWSWWKITPQMQENASSEGITFPGTNHDYGKKGFWLIEAEPSLKLAGFRVHLKSRIQNKLGRGGFWMLKSLNYFQVVKHLLRFGIWTPNIPKTNSQEAFGYLGFVSSSSKWVLLNDPHQKITG